MKELMNLIESSSASIAHSRISPYFMIYGLARALGMSDSILSVLLSQEEMEDLKAIRAAFEDRRLSRSLIVNVMPLVGDQLAVCSEEDQKKLRSDLDQLKGECSLSPQQFADQVFSYEMPALSLFTRDSSSAAIIEALAKKKQPQTDEELSPASEDGRASGGKSAEKAGTGTAQAKDTGDAGAADTARAGSGQAEDAGPASGPASADRSAPAQDNALMELGSRCSRLLADLLEVVKGQDQAVMQFVQGCFQAQIRTSSADRTTPAAVFLLMGPPGVGKTLLAMTAAKKMQKQSMLFDMAGIFTGQDLENMKNGIRQFVRANDDGILIFDELEKASSVVLDLFLQILDRGELDGADFSHNILIFTSNVGHNLYETGENANYSMLPKYVLQDAIRTDINPHTGEPYLSGPICSRLAAGNIIMFNHLLVSSLQEMVSDSFRKVEDALQKQYKVTLTGDSRVPLVFLYGYGGQMDARIACSQSSVYLKDCVCDTVRQLSALPAGSRRIDRISVEADPNEMDEEIRALFVNPDRAELLIACSRENERKFTPSSEKFVVHYAHSLKEFQAALQEDISLALIDPCMDAPSAEDQTADSGTIAAGGKASDSGAGAADGRAKAAVGTRTRDGGAGTAANRPSGAVQGVSIDDMPTEGMRIIRFLYLKLGQMAGSLVPWYCVETSARPFSKTDEMTLSMMGMSGKVSLLAGASTGYTHQVGKIADALYMQQRFSEFSRRGNVLNCNIRQVPEDGLVRVQFYDFSKARAVDASSRGRMVSDAERPKTRFSEVIGASQAKKELLSFAGYLKDPKKYAARHRGMPSAPKGILLYGPPGTGKTMLARALAGETDAAFIQVSAANLQNKYVGETEANIRRMFQTARRYAPSILFIDEIDAIGKQRTGDVTSQHTEKALNSLLTEMDGFSTDPRHPVFVLAATNFAVDAGQGTARALDSALVRRFDIQVKVDLPNRAERREFLALLLGRIGENEVSPSAVDNLADRTTGLSPAILQNVVKLAVRKAEEGRGSLNDAILLEAFEEYTYGEKHEWPKEYYRKVALHEAGHAYISWKGGEMPSFLTIVSRGNFGGYMQHSNREDSPEYSRQEVLWRIRTALAGRASEREFYGEERSVNTGASSDLQNATSLAMDMVCRYGMEGSLLSLDPDRVLRGPLADRYLQKASSLLDEEMARTQDLVHEGRDRIGALADRLLDMNQLTEAQIREVLGEPPQAPGEG